MNPYPPPPNQQPPPPGVFNPAQAQPVYPAGYGQYQGNPSNVVVVTQPRLLVNVGNCPNCGIGFVREEYSPMGLILCILFFPFGLICCLMMTQKICSRCRTRF